MKAAAAMFISVALCAIVAATEAASLTSQSQLPSSARVHGRVIAADTGTPVRGALVVISSASGYRFVATTDDEGRFDVRGVPATNVTLRVTKAGFVEVTSPLPNEAVKGGQTYNRGDVILVRGAVIAGRVLDTSGAPASDVVVYASRVVYTRPGNRTLIQGRSTTTNDLGDYRLYGLLPGTYYVTFSQSRTQPMEPRGSEGVQFVAASGGSFTTFYPGTPYSSEAQAITVQAGDQAIGMDVRLISVRYTSLSGRVVDSRGQPITGGRLSLKSLRSDGFGGQFSAAVTDSSSGRFNFLYVAPGEYRLEATTDFRMGPEVANRLTFVQLSGSSPEAPELANVLITVPPGGDPMTDIVIQTRAGHDVRGRVLVDGGLPSPAMLAGIKVTPTSIDAGAGEPLAGRPAALNVVEPDGAFVLRGLLGRCRLVVTGLPAGSALLRVTLNGFDVTDEGLDMDRGTIGGVDVQITTRPAIVKGRVTTVDGTAARAFVIVYAENPVLWSNPRHVVAKSNSSNGDFEFAALPAGRYLAAAVQLGVADQWADPAYLQRLRPQATMLTVRESETTTVVLRR